MPTSDFHKNESKLIHYLNHEIKKKPPFPYCKGFGVKSVSALPDVILRFKGKHAAAKGNIQHLVEGLVDKESKLQVRETLKAERHLYRLRVASAKALQKIEQAEGVLDANSNVDPADEMSAVSARLCKRALNTISLMDSVLVVARENLISADVIYEQRRLKTRAIAARKISACIQGAHQVNPDLAIDYTFSDASASSYRARHEATDAAIKGLHPIVDTSAYI